MARGDKMSTAANITTNNEFNSQTVSKGWLHYIFTVAMLLLGMMNIGHMLSFSGTLLPQLIQERDLTNTEKGLIASSSTLGTVVMALICSWLAHHLGRKKTLLALLTLGTVGFLLPLISSGQTIVLVLARILQGMGSISMAFAVYTAEISSPKIRGPVSGLGNLAVNTGIVQVYFMSAFVDWRTLCLILAIFPAFSLVLFGLFAPETPAWLIIKGKEQEAEQARQWFALESFPRTINAERKKIGLWERFTDPVFFKPIIVIMGIMGLMMLSGGFAFPFFAIQFFQKIGDTIDPDLPAIFIMALRLLGGLLGIIALRFVNRRSMLIVSNFVMAISIFALALTLCYESSLLSLFPSHKTIIVSYWPIALTAFFMLAFSVGMGIIPFVLLGELALPQNAALTSGLGVAFGYLVLFVLLQSYPYVVSSLGLWSLCFFFGIVSTLSVPFVYFCLPETRNRKVEDVAMSFGNNNEQGNGTLAT